MHDELGYGIFVVACALPYNIILWITSSTFIAFASEQPFNECIIAYSYSEKGRKKNIRQDPQINAKLGKILSVPKHSRVRVSAYHVKKKNQKWTDPNVPHEKLI